MKDLPAGRELDCEVAEKVMGWVWVSARSSLPAWDRYLVKNIGTFEMPADMSLPASVSDYIPHYSTSIEAAWEVVVKTGILGHQTLLEDENGDWVLGFRNPVTEAVDAYTSAKTAPHAICLAALKAVRLSRHCTTSNRKSST